MLLVCKILITYLRTDEKKIKSQHRKMVWVKTHWEIRYPLLKHETENLNSLIGQTNLVDWKKSELEFPYKYGLVATSWQMTVKLVNGRLNALWNVIPRPY